MNKELTYREKIQILEGQMDSIIDSVKKELKNDHLKKDLKFAKQYFQGKNSHKLTNEELSSGYLNAISTDEKGEQIAEFIINCWLLKHAELYHFFEEELKQINPDFNEIKELEAVASQKIKEKAVENFGSLKTYLFSVLNSVAFQKKELDALKNGAESELKENEKEAKKEEKFQNLNEIESHYTLKVARLTDKYESKILGLEKKYHKDVESYKKQIALLQTKLAKSNL